ncbi:hypothetical protein CDA61_01460, partial [Alcaligenes faecalis]
MHHSPSYAAELHAIVINNVRKERHTLLQTKPANQGPSRPTLPTQLVAEDSAQFLRHLVKQLRLEHRLSRLCIAGGDTSSLSTQALGIWGLSYLDLVSPGVAACICHGDDEIDGLELVLKGGQMGPADFFDRVIEGTS